MVAAGSPASADALAPATLARLMRFLILPIAILTFVNAIDRMNISYAGHAMSAELGLSPEAFGLGVSAFFLGYLVFQYPHAAMLRRFGIRPWLLVAVTMWGISGLWMSQVRSAEEFYAARFLLGLAEAGFAPGMTWYISQWVPRQHRATALAAALSAVPLSLVVGGPLCGWLLGIANPLGWPAWRFMFLIQAIPNFLLAIAAFWWFVDRPAQARWLDAAARTSLADTLAGEAMPAAAGQPARHLSDSRIWRCCLVWLLVMSGSYALVFWLPQLVRQIAAGGSEFEIGVLSALPQLGLAAGLILNGRHSDRSGERLWHVGLPALIGGAAMLVAAFLPVGWPVLALLILAAIGIGAAQGVFWTVPAAIGIGGGNVPVGVIALISMFGTAGGIVGPMMTGAIVQRTGSFAPAIGVLAAMLIASLLVILSLRQRRAA